MFQGHLRFRGHVVEPCYLRARRAAPAEVLLKITPKTRKAALEAFRRAGPLGGDFRGFTISGLSDLSFLADFPDLLYLQIDGHKQRINPRQLDGLANLRGLKLTDPAGGIDFSCFPELESFWGDWHPDHKNIPTCRELRYLDVWHYNAPSQDLVKLVGLVRLEHLRIVQTNLTSLAGIEVLEDVRYLTVSHATRLESLDALAGHDSIREIDFTTANRIQSYGPLAKIRRLRRLKLSRCAAMPNLKWLAGMENLDFFAFVDTNVVDGDLSPLLKLPRLRYVGTLDKKHYSHTSDDLNAELAKRT